MRHTSIFIHSKSIGLVIITCLFFGSSLFAQTPTTTITDYAIWGSVSAQIGSSSIQGGAIGSNTLVKSTGNMIAGTGAKKTNIYSGGTIALANSNVVNGNMTAGIFPFASTPPLGTIFSAGTSENFTGNIDVYGNIVIGGGTVNGSVKTPTSYKLGNVPQPSAIGTPTLAILPQQLPVITDFSLIYPTVGTQKITSGPIGPGNYGDLSISGNSTVTLNGPGTYVFKSITTTGPNSSIVFNFNPITTGNFLVYVYGDVILSRTSCLITNGVAGDAKRIFTEVHGTGATNGGVTFSTSNGSNGNGNTSSWFGSVWAPYAAIKIGTPNGPSMAVQGALWSGTQVNIIDGVNIVYNPSAVNTCTPPAITTQPTTPTATCTGSGTQTISVTATGLGLTYSWRKGGVAVTNGGVFSGQGTSTLTLTNAIASDAGSYDVVVSGTCTPVVTSNAVTVTVNALPSIVDAAGPDKPYNFDGVTTIGNPGLSGFTFKWTAPPGGLITGADDQATITVFAPGIYKLALKSVAGCTSLYSAEVSNKVNKLIGSELTSIYWNNPTGLPSPFFIIKNGKVRIDVIVQVNNYAYVLNLLQQEAYGLTNIVTNGVNGLNGSQLIITGDYPIINLLKLNLLGTYINFCRPFYEAFSNAGLVTSAGDTTMRSHFVRSGYKINGDGVKVGVISNSYATITNGTTATLPLQPITDPPNSIAQTFTINTVAVDISNGDLPGDTTILGIHSVNPKGFNKNVHVLQDYPATSTDEGRAMLQIVHDVAPGAELYFRTGFLTAGDFATGINELTAAGCKVIVDDVTYITEPYLKDGVVAKAVDAAKLNGVSYFSAAGNFKNKSYEKDFKPVDASQAGFAGKVAHDFSGGGDIFQHITLAPGNYTIVLQWVDDIYTSPIGQISGTKFDLDMFWTSNTNGTGLKGFNRDNTNGDPLEIMPFTINTTTDASFLILNNTSGGFPARIKYIIYRGDVQILEWPGGTSTVVGQANALGAIAVGAARFDKVPSYKPYNLTVPKIEDYSSIGGTKTEGVVRQKPDLVAPDGGNSTVKMGQDYSNAETGVELDGYSNFFGTSAAAPHAAAVAALIMQGRKKFLDQATTTPDAIKSLLQLTAVDMETAGFDFISGFGLVNADSAIRTFAAPIDSIIKVVVPEGIVPCSGPEFTVSIIGENFSYNTVVYLINGPGDSIKIIPTFVSSTEVTVTISSCVGNPEIKAYTPPKAGTNGTDGGFSNGKYFFSAALTITANDISKKYGETLTAPSFTIKVDGVLLQNTNPLLTLADIGLTNLTANTAANSQSDVGTYVITFNQYAPGDAALLKKYNYKFTDGKVTIAQMPLKVTPEDKALTYGQAVGKVTFKYEFNIANVSNPNDLKNTIKSFHEAFLPKNALAVVKDFKKPQGGYILSNTDLANMNMMASFNAVKNSRKFTLANNMLVPITDPGILQDNLNIQYLVDVASESIYDYAKIDKTTAKFYPGYPNINPKALLSASSIESDDNSKGVIASGGSSSLKILNGLLSQMINSGDGSIVPIVNGSLIQIVDAQMTDDNGIPLVPTVLAQYVNNGSWVILTNGVTGTTSLKILNGALKILNGTTTTSLKILNGTTTSLKILNGTTEVTVDPTVQVLGTTTALKVLNNIVYKVINGVDVPIPDGSFVQLGDGGLAQVKNGSFQVVANTAVLNGLTGSSLKILNGSTGSSLKILNGSTGSSLKILNTGALGTGATNNNTAVVLDSEDGTNDGDGTSALGNMFGINMITGLDVGKQYLVPGVLVNPNFDISYGLGTVDIAKAEITITPLPNTRDYDGSTTAAAIPKITIGALAGGDIAVLKETYDNKNAGTGKSMIPTVVSIVDALGASTTANYNVTPNPLANGVINKIPLTVTADPQSKSYDGLKFTAFTSTITGFVNNETSAEVIGAAAYTGAATSATAAGTYTITPAIGSLSATNYNFTPFVDGTLVINISTSTITVNGSIVTGTTSFTYSGLPQGPSTSTVTGSTGSVTYSYVGTLPTTYGPIATKPTNAGTYSVTATVAADGNYYAATSAATAFTISVFNPTITVTGSTSFTYTGSTQGPSTSTFTGSTGAVTYSYVGTLLTSYGPSATKPTNAGTYNAISTVAADANYNRAISSAYGFTINKASLTVTAENKTKQYGENNPPLTYTYSGFVNNEDSVTSGIKGANNGTPALTTTATQYSAIGTTYPISITSGTLTSLNYTFTTVPGLLNIIPNNCPLLSHDPMNFVSTSKVSTSLWTSVTIKVSGQLTKDGDYIVVRAGDLTLNNITSTAGNSTIPIPNGKIIADSRVVSPVTTYDALNNMWTTKVPLFFASTSDIFITGAIINADNGFTAKNSTANSVIRARFYSNKNFSDKWVYQMAAYQPQFTYGQIDKFNDLGVQSINGIYRAGTPIPQILNIVNGGSGNGGNNYAGSQSNQNAFTACAPSSDAAVNRVITNASSIQPAARQQVQDIDVKGDIQVFPNPASAYITLSYIPASTGNSAITLFTIDGKKVMEIDNGVREADKKYVKRIDVSRLIRGVYIIQVIGTDKTTIKKIIISR